MADMLMVYLPFFVFGDTKKQRNMRKYQALWEQLKLEKSLELTAPRDTHKRLISGLCKESLKDLGARNKYAQAGKSYIIRHSQIRDTLYLVLEERDKVPPSFDKKLP